MADGGRNNEHEHQFTEWVREHGRAVRGFLLAMVRRPDVADDLTQEVFCRAWQARSRYQEQGNARAYLLRIADRLACDRGRRAARPIHLDEDGWRKFQPLDPADGPSQRALAVESAEELTAALDQLTPVQRRVLLMRFFGQCSFAEIADALDCPLNTTLSHCRRGLEALRNRLAEKIR